MTIALGFKCPDGIVLATDSQMTKEGGLKFEGQKVFHLMSDRWTVILAFAGSTDLMKPVVEELDYRIEDFIEQPGMTITTAVRLALERVAEDFTKKYRDKTLEFLCGASDGVYGQSLFSVRGKIVSPAVREFIGVGDSSVIRFLADIFDRESMSYRECLQIGCYMVKQATRYIDGCGGPIQTAITSKGHIGIADEPANKADYSMVEKWFGWLVLAYAGSPTSEGDKKIFAETFVQALKVCSWAEDIEL